MTVMGAVAKDSPLWKAWEAYRESEDFRNSFNWATRLNSYDHDRAVDGSINRATDGQRGEWVKGSLWDAFTAGFHAAGGNPKVGEGAQAEDK
jgi:hypothetical protein